MRTGARAFPTGTGRLWTSAILSVILLSACQRIEDRVAFEGEFFRTKASPVSRDMREQFVVEVPGVSRSYEGAREAGRFEATRYCIETYGTSDIRWSSGPDDDPDTITIERDRLILSGTCLF